MARNPRAREARATKTRAPRPRAAKPRAVVVLAAYPGRGPAETAARALVADRLVACATVAPGARAFYRWEGRLRADASVLLWGKTTAARAQAVVRAIRARHPDRVPEILVIPIRGGHGPYLDWLRREVRRS